MNFIKFIFIFQIPLFYIFCQEETNPNASENPEYDLSKLYKFNCTNSNIDCSGNGICSDDGLKCEEGKTTQNGSEEPEYDLTKLYKFNCTDSDIDCSGNGICSEDGLKCDCKTGFQTFYENFEDYLILNIK